MQIIMHILIAVRIQKLTDEFYDIVHTVETVELLRTRKMYMHPVNLRYNNDARDVNK